MLKFYSTLCFLALLIQQIAAESFLFNGYHKEVMNKINYVEKKKEKKNGDNEMIGRYLKIKEDSENQKKQLGTLSISQDCDASCYRELTNFTKDAALSINEFGQLIINPLLIENISLEDFKEMYRALLNGEDIRKTVTRSHLEIVQYQRKLVEGASKIISREVGRTLRLTNIRFSTIEHFNFTDQPDYAGASELNDMYIYVTGWSNGGLGAELTYLGRVCSRSKTPKNLGFISLDGKWEGDIVGGSANNWDIIVLTHSLGHIFGAKHTHSYNVQPRIDECVDKQNGKSAPRDDKKCVRGTIMSYCHQCGGNENIDLKYHPVNVIKMQNTLSGKCGKASEGIHSHGFEHFQKIRKNYIKIKGLRPPPIEPQLVQFNGEESGSLLTDD